MYIGPYLQDYHFSGISGNLEVSGNSAKVSEKSGKRPYAGEKSGNVCVVRECVCSQGNLIVTAYTYELYMNCDVHGHVFIYHTTYLHFIRTVIHFSYGEFAFV